MKKVLAGVLFSLVMSSGIHYSLECMIKGHPFERLPQELKKHIAELSLESALNYNFDLSKILFRAPGGISSEAFTSVAFSPDGKTVLTGGDTTAPGGIPQQNSSSTYSREIQI
ncbi:hypothetical protein H0W26_05525 [Candidatus Dependentiae bacterium]|nr:hypothetical protein [Candidatus Dependentiae bacterium]